jgi:ABC-type multidrug transport system ATPase subunit
MDSAAFLADPPILVVDKATHDLDPDGARRVTNLIAKRHRSCLVAMIRTKPRGRTRAEGHRP